MSNQSSSRAVVHEIAKAKPFWVLGDRLSIIAHLDGQDLYVVDVAVPPGSGTPPHKHPAPEILRLLEGTIDFWCETDQGCVEVRAKPGDVFTVPPGAPHGYRNTGATEARMMLIADRRMLDFFREVGAAEAPPPGPPAAEEISRVMGAAARHGFEILR
jgi:quercetin dioxygenase-like cupin family protein